MSLATWAWPDCTGQMGLVHNFPCWSCQFPPFTGHVLPHWACGKESEAVDASRSFLEEAQLGHRACWSMGWAAAWPPLKCRSFEGMKKHNVWQPFRLLSHY